MHRDQENVVFPSQGLDFPQNFLRVNDGPGPRPERDRHQAHFGSPDGEFRHLPVLTGKLDALIFQGLLGVELARIAEVPAVVVGQGENLEAGVLEGPGEAGGGAEGINVGALRIFGAQTPIAQGSFQVAEAQVGLLEKVSNLVKKVATVFGRKFGSGEIASQHNVSHRGHGQGRRPWLSVCRRGGGQKKKAPENHPNCSWHEDAHGVNLKSV
jgi:hypothetical protein